MNSLVTLRLISNPHMFKMYMRHMKTHKIFSQNLKKKVLIRITIMKRFIKMFRNHTSLKTHVCTIFSNIC